MPNLVASLKITNRKQSKQTVSTGPISFPWISMANFCWHGRKPDASHSPNLCLRCNRSKTSHNFLHLICAQQIWSNFQTFLNLCKSWERLSIFLFYDFCMELHFLNSSRFLYAWNLKVCIHNTVLTPIKPSDCFHRILIQELHIFFPN